MAVPLALLLLLMPAETPVAAAPVVCVAEAPAGERATGAVPLRDLTSLRRLWGRRFSARGTAADSWMDDASRSAELALVARAVLAGEVDDLCAERPTLTGGERRRDREAYQLLSIGYSAREVADMLSGRITRRALDTARRMLMAGAAEGQVADFLDAQYRALGTPGVGADASAGGHARGGPDASGGVRGPDAERRMRSDGVPVALSQAIERAARTAGLDARLVHAVIQVESNYDPTARSAAGAVGLMQLMPATARALGVNPWRPEENVAGGVRYLSQLIARFKDVNTALIAYNGGPGYAARYRRGEVPLYGETRAYVAQVRRLLVAGSPEQRR